jgi:hypothetical protein
LIPQGRVSGPRITTWAGVLLVAAVVAVFVVRRERVLARQGAVLFSPGHPGCAIVVPSGATDAERRAAETLQATLAGASGLDRARFAIREERGAVPRGAIWVGATRRGARHLRPERKPPHDSGVGFVVASGEIFLKGERREGIESAVGWFLEHTLGAQWFIPGPLGEHVPRREELRLGPGLVSARPGFVHRDLGLEGSPDVRRWYGRNRLEARFEHGHNLASIFRPADFVRAPEMAPLRNGQRFIPPASSANWQPNLLSPQAVRHAAAAVIRAFDQDPQRLSFSLSINDTDLYDESEDTLAAVAPPRYFRHRPDYSKLVFGFTNAVAHLVAARHPDRWLPAYAYLWCENTPGFPIARNVVPFLTADRSQWAYPEFAAEDKALIERWCRSGAEIVGVYDYFYGAPHLAPRPTLYAVKESIPFHHRAGVRAFYAETYANWGLDGPKPWLAAKLLWAPGRNPEDLLDLYYREFWREAAEPMREFFATAERTWREQLGPPLWLRFYKDDDQAHIYPLARRAELRAHLAAARERATSVEVCARLELVTAAFSVTEAYWTFSAAREALSRLARPGAEPAALVAAWRRYRAARAEFVWRFSAVRREHPLALAPQDIESYLRNQPDARVARELASTVQGRAVLQESAHLPWLHCDATPDEVTRLFRDGVEVLTDPGWTEVRTLPVGSSAASDWTVPGSAWFGRGEAWEGRTVELGAGAGGKQVLRIASSRTEDLGQWVPAVPGAWYAATVKVRAKTSPGTSTHLVAAFLDEKWQHIEPRRTDRLPAGTAVQEETLCVVVRAPPEARHVGFGLRVLNQIGDDFAEFSAASLRRLDP